MGAFVVKQPDGLYAVFDTIVDEFIVLDSNSFDEAAKVSGVGQRLSAKEFTLFGERHSSEDPAGRLWDYCMRARAICWREEKWSAATRMLCRIIDRGRKKKEAADNAI